jgi:DNA-binding transcriptional regulator YiaG
MTPAELHTIRAALGLTQGSLATALGIGRRTIQHWEADERAVPETVAKVMRAALIDRTILDRIAAA